MTTRSLLLSRIVVIGLALASWLTGTDGFAANPNQWTNSVSSLWWVVTNWSAGQLPDASFPQIVITNTGSKTVLLDSATAAANRSVRSLLVAAPDGFTNTLRIADLAGGAAFANSKPLIIDRGGALEVTNSTLAVGDTFDVSGILTLYDGLIDSTPNLVDVRVGRTVGATGTVTLNGGTLLCFGFRVGELGGSQGNATINGGTLRSTSVVSMGEILNSPGTMTILSGELIATNDITKVGNLASGVLNQSGGSSALAFFSIGDNAPGTVNFSGGQLTVTPNTILDVTRVGNFGTGQWNISGGSVRLGGEFHLGDNPGIFGGVLMTGGTLVATNDLVAIGRYGIGEMTITNATATFTNVSVGRHDASTGTLRLQTNGSLFCIADLSIGRFTNAVGHVLVSGGLLSVTNDDIWTGRDGSGELLVSSGTVRSRGLFVGRSEDGTNTPQGTVTLTGGLTVVSSNLAVGTSGLSSGHVSVQGGRLVVSNAAAGAVLSVASGTLTLNQGTITADRLLVTNRNAQFTFPSGTLEVASMTVSNGVPFVVGDGVSPATVHLQGGTFTFADGLVISPNAQVTGCGTIIGAISNSGTLNTNCGAKVDITGISRAGTLVTVSFSTVSGMNHVLEYKNALSDPTWNAILPATLGTGSVAVKQDPLATNSTRFYRISSQ